MKIADEIVLIAHFLEEEGNVETAQKLYDLAASVAEVELDSEELKRLHAVYIRIMSYTADAIRDRKK